MEKRLVVTLLLAGLCAAASCQTRKYHLVQTNKNWTEARSYCREKHTDLVTVHSLEEQQQLQNIVRNETSDFKKETNNRFWIGLYRDSENWQWSTGDAVSYTNWTAGTDTHFCATADAGGSWGQSVCHDQKPFMCYNETSNITERYTLISTLKTWPDAQQYCREHHTDLVSIKSASENEDMKKKAPTSPFWIGLFNNPWKWNDGGNSTFQNWDIGEPDNMLGNENCTMVYHTQGQWRDAPCSQRYFFFCYEGTFSRCSECHGNAVCQPSSKPVQCVCAEGFVGDGFSCYNRTECNKTTDCCPHGFQWSSEHGCADIDECAADGDLNDCPPQSSCVNTIGSFHCLSDHVSKRSSRSVSFSCINQPCPSGQDCITGSCADPCQQYKVLDEPWRSTNFSIAPSSVPKCDRGLNGWYRFLVNDSVRMPETCVPEYSCGTHAPMWISGTHPLETDGIVSRQSCGKWSSNCCYFKTTVHIKACPGNYHVYKFQGTPGCSLAYCAESNPTTKAPETTAKLSTETTERSTETTERPTETTERPTETTERPTETTERPTETTERPTETTERPTETRERPTETQTSPGPESSPAAKAPGTTEPSTGTQTSPEPGKRRQVVRIEINAAEGLDPEDPKITDAILAQLQERLPKGMTLRWIKKDGKIFHQQEEEEKEKEMETCSKP